MPLTKPQIKELLKPGKHFSCEGTDVEICVKIVAVADLPTRQGKFQIVAFVNSEDQKDHVALVKGVVGAEKALRFFFPYQTIRFLHKDNILLLR